MKSKGIIGFLISLLLILGLVMACAPAAAPTEAPPTEAPPTEAPPTEAPPTEAPPTEAPPTAPTVELPPPGWSLTLDEIPEIQNKRSIHVALFAGPGILEAIVPAMKEFAEHTGVPVTHEIISFSAVYPKVNLELVAGTGAYDIVQPEMTYTAEWSPYLYSIEELADKYEPGGWEATKIDLAGYSPTLLRCASDTYGTLMALPMYEWTMGCFYRKDVFDNPVEKENFRNMYGYELAAPTTWEQVYDHGEFFTRKEGDNLKGETLDHDIYGLTLMAGRFEINDEIWDMMRSKDAKWVKVIRDEEGKPIKFIVTKKDMEIVKECIEIYNSMLPFTPPETFTFLGDQAAEMMGRGTSIEAPTLYVNYWPFARSIFDEAVPDGELELAKIVGHKPYTGCFESSIPRASENPEAAYWLARYFSSREFVIQLAEVGGCVPRRDVLEDPKWKEEKYDSYFVGRPAEIVIAGWDDQEEDVNDWIHNLSAASGKIYEEQIVLLHDAAIGARTPEETVRALVSMTVAFQRTMGKIPIEIEPELKEWLGL